MAAHDEILRYHEIMQIAEAMAELGVQKIKLTGGEPLVRRNLSALVKELKELPGISQVTLTTNGVLLGEQMDDLAKAGINGINLSLDTLNEERYQQITRRDAFQKAYEGFQKALEYKDIPLKVNCVLMDQSLQELCQLAELSRKHPVHVRFIEMMPIGLGKTFSGMNEDELLRQLREKYGQEQVCSQLLGNGPAHYYSFPGFLGKIGFISAVSHKFCSSCNRVRLTAQGYLKACLQYETGKDLRGALRQGASKEDIKDLIKETLAHKPECHAFFQEDGTNVEQKIMSQIGG